MLAGRLSIQFCIHRCVWLSQAGRTLLYRSECILRSFHFLQAGRNGTSHIVQAGITKGWPSPFSSQLDLGWQRTWRDKYCHAFWWRVIIYGVYFFTIGTSEGFVPLQGGTCPSRGSFYKVTGVYIKCCQLESILNRLLPALH